MSPVNTTLLELFQAHGIEAIAHDDWVGFSQRSSTVRAAIVRETEHSFCLSIQLDVRLEIVPGLTLVESFSGLGKTREEAAADALKHFSANSFHVLLAAFFQCNTEQVTTEEWTLGGRPSLVTLGTVGIRGKPPVQGEALVRWFHEFAQRLQEKNLGPGTHWIRLYYAQMEGKALPCEVLLDNAVWEEMQSAMAGIDWPSGDDFYSVRIFLVIQDKRDPTGQAESAVAQVASLLADNPDLSENDVFQALVDQGVSASLADRAYKFTQIAWGRRVLDGLGITFSPDYFCFDAEGKTVETGALAEDGCFAAATRLLPAYARTPAFRRLALTSADVNAINQALHAGSKPEDLITSPAYVFVEAPTPQGMQTAREAINAYLNARYPHKD